GARVGPEVLAVFAVGAHEHQAELLLTPGASPAALAEAAFLPDPAFFPEAALAEAAFAKPAFAKPALADGGAIARVAGDEHLVARGDGGRTARAGELDLPQEVVLRPRRGHVLVVRGAAALGPAEGRPVGG